MAIVSSASGKPNRWDNFKLPFDVATVTDLGLRAYINKGGQAEWLWSRVHNYCQIREQPGKLLRRNKDSFFQALEDCQVPVSQWHYRSIESNDLWREHTLESACLLVKLLWVTRNRGLSAQTKALALDLFCKILSKIANAEWSFCSFTGIVLCRDGRLKSQALTFHKGTGKCFDLTSLFQGCTGGLALWDKLSTTTWLGKCISTPMAAASLEDLWLLCAYSFCHPREALQGQYLWECFGSHILPILLWHGGQSLNKFALALVKEDLDPLPTLKTKSGCSRKRVDHVNRMVLLFKVRREKAHRARVASSHEELGGSTNRLVRMEAFLDTMHYSDALSSQFKGTTQLSVSFDPSGYGGKDIMVAVCYDPAKNLCGHLLNQQLAHTMMSEVHSSLLDLAKQRKLVRIDGYKELKGLSKALESINVSLDLFTPPSCVICRPLVKGELRLKMEDGHHMIFQEATGQAIPEIPLGYNLGSIPALVTVSDQGPSNMACLNFLQYSSDALVFYSFYDCFHRTWNDMKLSFKKVSFPAWKTILQYTLICNLSYGPFGSGSWWTKKKFLLEQFLQSHSSTSPQFLKYKGRICQERRAVEPHQAEDLEGMFMQLAHLTTFQQKGPLIKLMRWFSWFEAMTWMGGEFWATKMVLESGGKDDESDGDPEIPEEKDPQKELQALRRKKGTFKLAPTLVTDESMAIKDCIMAIGKASWKAHAARARSVVSPQQNLELNVSCSANKFWATELEEMVEASLWDGRHLLHLWPEYNNVGEVVFDWHIELFNQLLEQRSMSLVSFHCMPPNAYAHALSPNTAVAMQGFKLAEKHFHTILQLEEAELAGAEIKALRLVYWRLNPLVRILFLAYEQDLLLGRACTPKSQALVFQRLLSQHMGDSRMIEVAHQHGKDLLRSSRQNNFSNLRIQANTLRSGALEERQTPMVTFTNAQKVMGHQGTYNMPVANKLTSKGHALPEKLQRMMAPKGKKVGVTWPSPSPSSLFLSAAATSWLFHFSDHLAGTGTSINQSWLSICAVPGSIIAQQSTGKLLKVVAAAEYSFLGWHLLPSPQQQGGAQAYVLQPNKDLLGFHYILDIDDWVCLSVKPGLLTPGQGPVCWIKSGEPMSLDMAFCLNKITRFTQQQVKALIQHLGGATPPGAQLRECQEILIKICVPEDLWGKAMAQLKQKDEVDDLDSEMSEVVSELAQDDANQQDIKEFKEKKRQRKLRRKFGPDKALEGKKGRGRGRGRGKGGKGKGKGKLAKRLRANKRPKADTAHVKEAAGGEDEEEEDPDSLREPKKARLDEDVGNAGMDGGAGNAAMEVEVPAHASDKPQVELAEAEVPQPAPSSPAKSSAVEAQPADAGAGSSSPAGSSAVVAQHADAGAGSSSPAGSSAVVAQHPDAGAPATTRKKIYSSPEQLLTKLSPPGCTMGLSFMDHRFTCRFPSSSGLLHGQYKQQGFTRTFVTKRSWKDALSEVHKYCWTKWNILKDTLPLPSGQVAQEPGFIPPDILEEMADIVKTLPEVTRY
eukprot:s248_g16.t1